MIRWLFDWQEATRHPRTILASLFLLGCAGGGAIGYFHFGHSAGFAVALGLGVAGVLSMLGWRTIHGREAGATQRVAANPRRVVARLAVPFGALGIAAVAGAAFGSAIAFILTFLICFVAALLLRHFVLR